MARTGRPKKEIDQKAFEGLCAIQCTEAEMCAVLGVCEDTLNKWCKRTYKMTFSEAIKSKSCMGKTSLRRTQFKLAEKNAAMAIWLGKQYLGQKEDADISQIGTNVQDDALSQSLRTFAEGVNSDER